MRRMRVCGEPGCPELVRTGWCPAHRPPPRRLAFAEARPRGPNWDALRSRLMKEEPWCRWQGCKLPADELDHVIPLSKGGHPTNPANLQPLCSGHHLEKTRREASSAIPSPPPNPRTSEGSKPRASKRK